VPASGRALVHELREAFVRDVPAGFARMRPGVEIPQTELTPRGRR
jgi:hypothetical protein